MSVKVLSIVIALVWQVGWRTDGTGRYPQAEPPVSWSTETGVVWKTPMPSWSNATPVIVGEKIFVCSEPAQLVCVNRADGTILWQRPNGYDQTVPADKVAELTEKIKQTDEAGSKWRQTQGKLKGVKKKLKKTPDDAELKKQAEELRAQVGECKKQYELLKEHATPATHKVNGYSTHTPVSDGKHVWVATGYGTVSCYDLAGERKWIKLVEKPVNGYGNSSSPVLVDGKLIVHFRDMVALDAVTGKEVWRAKAKINTLWGTPAVAQVDKAKLIITANGDVIRASGGEVLVRRISKLEFGSPMVIDGIVYFPQHRGGAMKLPDKIGEQFAVEQLWRTTKIKKDRYYASSLVHDGLIYAITRYGVLSVLDAATGDIVYSRKQQLKKKEEVYSSITLGGKYVYVSSDSGATIVLEPGREYKEVAANALETFRSCPVFEGARMYIRGYKNLYCIGK